MVHGQIGQIWQVTKVTRHRNVHLKNSFLSAKQLNFYLRYTEKKMQTKKIK